MDNENFADRDQKGLRAAIRIMEKWGLNRQDQAHILKLAPNLLDAPGGIDHLGSDQLTRISYLLNIHAVLRELFQNPENHAIAMTSNNHNPPFNGKAPLDFIRSGELSALKEIFEHLELLKYGHQ